MTDSESDLSNPNVFTFQSGNTTVNARGPNTNANFSFRNNHLASSMYLPRNFGQQRYAESVSDQRSIYYRRETSPMSIHSACDIRPRNFLQYGYSGMGSHQSVFNGRSGSPVSMRSIDSSASVSAADIAFAFKNVKFNKYDLRVIKEAYNKLMKQRFRKRIEKRRNMRLFLKGSRRRSGDDSGEQGSDSSVSSDDCRSIKTSYKENMSYTGSARMNLTDFRKTFRDNNMVQNCTDNYKQNSFKNMFSINTSSRNHNLNNSTVSKPSQSIPTLKDRFKNGFVLPSQRFNRSVASSVIPENSEKPKNMEPNHRRHENYCISNNKQNQNYGSGSEEEIFSGATIQDKTASNTHKEPPSKRRFESDEETSLPDKKKSKMSSPVKNSQANTKVPLKNNNPVNNNEENSNNFEFAKPTLPARKSKSKVQEKVIAKSKQPLTGFVEHIPSPIVANPEPVPPINIQEKPCDNQSQEDNFEATQGSDVSARPSFTKRKLFTQTLDVAEQANSSSDGLNSPLTNVYSAIQKEKNKARKLVTSLSCLNREVPEDNNFIDLIHKIVPPDRMNVTNQTTINQTKPDVNNSNKKEDDDKWDVTSVISMCNENDVSDTFTDEEIFASDTKNKDTKKNKTDKPKPAKANVSTKPKQNVQSNNEIPRECRIVIENIDCHLALQKPVEYQNTNLATNNANNTAVKCSAKTFWDTDFESDAECQLTIHRSFPKENQIKDNIAQEASNQEFKKPLAPTPNPVSKIQVPETSRWLNNTNNDTIMNNTLDSTRKFNISTLSVRSHRTTKKKKCCSEACFQDLIPAKPVTNVKPTLKPQTKDLYTSKSEASAKNASKSNTENKTISKPDNKSKTLTKSETNSTKKSQSSKDTNKNKVEKSTKNTENRHKTPNKNVKPTSTENKSTKKKQLSNEANKNKVEKSKRTEKRNKTPTKSTKPKAAETNSTKKKQSSNEANKNKVEKNKKTDKSNKTPTKNTKPLAAETNSTKKNLLDDKANKEVSKSSKKSEILKTTQTTCAESSSRIQKPAKSRSTSRTRQKSEETTTTRKGIENTKTITLQSSPKDRPVRSCRTPSQNRSIENCRSSHQFDITPLNITKRLTRQNISLNNSSLQESPKIEFNCKILKSKVSQASSEPNENFDSKISKPDVQKKILINKANPYANKSISTIRSHRSPQNIILKTNRKAPKNVSCYQTPKYDRPIRTCRTPGLNKSIENYKSSIRGR